MSKNEKAVAEEAVVVEAVEVAGDAIVNEYATDAQECVDEMGVIGANTLFEGNIATKGSITILGTVMGDIDALGEIIIGGFVKGKISCRSNTVLKGANVEADIDAKGLVTVESDASLKGKISCEAIKVDGGVIGDIMAIDRIDFTGTAVVKGNIKAKHLSIGLGAKLDGNVSIG